MIELKKLIINKIYNMKKQTIEIEVPDGKQAVIENNTIKFIPEEPYWKKITNFQDVFFYVRDYLPECYNLIESYNKTIKDSYEETVISYRIIIAALTNNEKRYLTKGDRWYPVVQLCANKDNINCLGDAFIGTIESEVERYYVIGGAAHRGMFLGLGCFLSHLGVFAIAHDCCSFSSVSSKEIAEHISTYFGKFLFNVQYGGTNGDWKWVE